MCTCYAALPLESCEYPMIKEESQPGYNYEIEKTCTVCPTGWSQDQIGEMSCKECEAGRYQNQEGENTCYSCFYGRYQPQTGATACEICPSGWSQNQYGAHACNECTPGKYQDQTGGWTCKTCPYGKYQDQSGATFCKNLYKAKYLGSGLCFTFNRYSDISLESCTEISTNIGANAFSYSEELQRCFYAFDGCDDVGEFTESSTYNRYELVSTCGAGEYVETSYEKNGVSLCYMQNHENWYRAYNDKDFSVDSCFESCTGVNGDEISSLSDTMSTFFDRYNYGHASVNVFLPGTQNSRGCECFTALPLSTCQSPNSKSVFLADNMYDIVKTCSACPTGKYQDEVDTMTLTCKNCPVGQFQNQTGATSCQSCSPGRFQDQTGGVLCQKCPYGKTSEAGASSCTDVYEARLMGAGKCLRVERDVEEFSNINTLDECTEINIRVRALAR